MFDLLFHEDQSSLCGKMRIFVQSEVRAMARWTLDSNLINLKKKILGDFRHSFLWS